MRRELLTLGAALSLSSCGTPSPRAQEVFIAQGSTQEVNGDTTSEAREVFHRNYQRYPFTSRTLLEMRGEEGDCALHIVANLHPLSEERTIVLSTEERETVLQAELQPIEDLPSRYEFTIQGMAPGEYILDLPRDAFGAGFISRKLEIHPDCTVVVTNVKLESKTAPIQEKNTASSHPNTSKHIFSAAHHRAYMYKRA